MLPQPVFGSMPEQSALLQTYVMSLPPRKIVVVFIFASNLPCCARSEVMSSSVAPAISTMMNCFPVPPSDAGRSCAERMVRSVRP